MNLPDIVNVALGLVLLYVLLSSITSLLFDLVSSYAQFREEVLFITVNRLVAGKPDEPWSLWKLLCDRAGRKMKKEGDRVLKLPLIGNRLSRFLFDRSLRLFISEYRIAAPGAPSTQEEEKDIVREFWMHPKIQSLIAPGADAPAAMAPATFANVLIDITVPRDAQHMLPTNRLVLLRALEAAPPQVPRELRNTLRTLGLSSEISAGATHERLWAPFRNNIANWFEEAGKRATEMYRKSTQVSLLVMGFILAAILNADSFRILHVLSKDQPLREAVATYAEKLEEADRKLAATPAANAVEADSQQRQLQASVERLRELEGFGFPLGWVGHEHGFLWLEKNKAMVAGWTNHEGLQLVLSWTLALLLKVLGLGVTALAVSLGAPFWYSAMRKLLELRRGQSNRSVETDSPETSGSTPSRNENGLALAEPLPLEIGYDLAAPAVGFDSRKAYWLAKASLAAYSPEKEVEALVKKSWHFHDFAFFSAKGTQAFCAADRETVLIAFRGTEVSELNDIVTDARCKLVDLKDVGQVAGLEGLVHQGFQEGVGAVWEAMLTTLEGWRTSKGREIRQVYCTGHSLGGALATVTFLRLSASAKWPVPTLYTFGCPKVGNDALTRSLDRLYPERIFRFVHQTDVVPQLPPLPAYHHCGQELNFDGNGQLRREISGLGRFLGYASSATEGLKQAGKKAIDDHSMSHYVARCEALTQTT